MGEVPEGLQENSSSGSHRALCLWTVLTKQHRYKLAVFEDKSLFSLLNTEETKVKNFEEQQQCDLQPAGLGRHDYGHKKRP